MNTRRMERGGDWTTSALCTLRVSRVAPAAAATLDSWWGWRCTKSKNSRDDICNAMWVWVENPRVMCRGRDWVAARCLHRLHVGWPPVGLGLTWGCFTTRHPAVSVRIEVIDHVVRPLDRDLKVMQRALELLAIDGAGAIGIELRENAPTHHSAPSRHATTWTLALPTVRGAGSLAAPQAAWRAGGSLCATAPAPSPPRRPAPSALATD